MLQYISLVSYFFLLNLVHFSKGMITQTDPALITIIRFLRLANQKASNLHCSEYCNIVCLRYVKLRNFQKLKYYDFWLKQWKRLKVAKKTWPVKK